ncbi:MAG: NUDIX domain-containing protein [Clostridium sp.]|uniref:NUDIX domain-containing protein n=1 Tax=Clostridium sp. TaxID=1506 RepID=UPI00302A9ECB
MGNNTNYIQWIRSKVGHEKIIISFAGGCIFNGRGELLLQRRSDSNKWGFPGGAIEIGETPQMAAIREAKEETGLDVEVIKRIILTKISKGNILLYIRVIYYLLHLEGK